MGVTLYLNKMQWARTLVLPRLVLFPSSPCCGCIALFGGKKKIPPKRAAGEEEEGLYLQLQTRERVQTGGGGESLIERS